MKLAELAEQGRDLDRLIEVKKKLTRPKDRLMLLQLEATRDEKRKAT